MSKTDSGSITADYTISVSNNTNKNKQYDEGPFPSTQRRKILSIVPTEGKMDENHKNTQKQEDRNDQGNIHQDLNIMENKYWISLKKTTLTEIMRKIRSIKTERDST